MKANSRAQPSTKQNTMSSSDLLGRFQPYTLALFDARSAGGFATRQFITFPSRRRKFRFIRFLRNKCHARRRGNWASIPGQSYVTKAVEYAVRHRSYVYGLTVKGAPTPRGRRHHVMGDDSDCEGEESADEDVAEEDIHSGAEDL